MCEWGRYKLQNIWFPCRWLHAIVAAVIEAVLSSVIVAVIEAVIQAVIAVA
jgi:hypothetical protein